MKGIGKEPIYSVQSIKGKRIITDDKDNMLKNYETAIKNDLKDAQAQKEVGNPKQGKIERAKNLVGLNNDNADGDDTSELASDGLNV